MKKIWRDRWLEWLETPGRPQAMHLYFDDEQQCYCALGGLIQLMIDRGVTPMYFTTDGCLIWASVSSAGIDGVYQEIRRITGLPTWACSSVIILNDDDGLSFPEIAAWVRETIPEEV